MSKSPDIVEARRLSMITGRSTSADMEILDWVYRGGAARLAYLIESAESALAEKAAEVERLRGKVALFDFLFETCSYNYGNGSASEPSPAEFGVCWAWQQSTPEKPGLLDELTRQAALYYQRYVNEMDPEEPATEWDRQVMEHLAALTPPAMPKESDTFIPPEGTGKHLLTGKDEG